jgi:6-phosphogluconolactonase (cycloisomerase 2 family)
MIRYSIWVTLHDYKDHHMRLTKPLDLQIRNTRAPLSVLLMVGWLTACGGGGGGGGATVMPPPPQSYTIGGSVSGLTAASGLVLQDNGGDDLTVMANATTFTFVTKVAAGGAYAVTVKTQPTNETCTVTGGSGTVGSSNVTSVSIACTSNTTPTFTIGGTLTGYTGAGLVLQDNGGDNYTVPTKATSFTFPTKVASGAAYAVTVLTQPSSPAQTCTVTGGSGTVGTANVTTVHIACANQAFTIGGTISGLTGATGLVLQDNGGDNLTVKANATSFTFKTPVSAGATYAVTVLTQPSTPTQTCTVTLGSGTVVASNVTNVAIKCVTSYLIGGTISGLTGSGLVLQDNGGDNLSVAAKATTFTFATGLQTAAAYAVTVLTQPKNPTQYCTVSSGTGNVASANISSVAVSCINIGRFAFVTNSQGGASNTGNVSAFTIDPKSGALTPVAGSPFTGGNGPSAVAVDVTGAFAYVANQTDVDVTIFSVNQTSGALTATGSASTNGTIGASIAVAPSNKYVYVGGYATPGSGSVYGLVNSPPGTLAAVPNGPFAAGDTPLGIAVDPASQLVFATAAFQHFLNVYKIGSDGSLTSAGQYSPGSGPYGVAVYPLGGATGGFVYTANSAANTISGFSYDGSGNLTELTTSPYYPANTQPEGIAIDPQGQYLYVANYADNNVTTFSIDSPSGALTVMGTVLTGHITTTNPGPINVTVDPSGQFVYVVNYTDGSVSLFSSKAGVLTLVNTWATDQAPTSIAIG